MVKAVQAIGAFQAAQQALMHNGFHDFDPNDASAIIIALHKLGFRIVYVGVVK